MKNNLSPCAAFFFPLPGVKIWNARYMERAMFIVHRAREHGCYGGEKKNPH